MWKYFSIFSAFSILLPLLWLIFKPIDMTIIIFWFVNFIVFLCIILFINYKRNLLKNKPIVYLAIDVVRLLTVLIFFIIYITVFDMKYAISNAHLLMFVALYLYFLFAYVFIILKQLK
ncbi:MAG: hypothetical protein BWX61_00140 [Bacteroidetes bacterium ADurb.Bin035]|nr:MAG: hypothetical protein BWX61_00140 [Bacteroidetes bacterium ADurb.Bin035]HCM29569.1 hypothetical protein [Bacteroidales bacterium]